MLMQLLSLFLRALMFAVFAEADANDESEGACDKSAKTEHPVKLDM